MSLRDRATEAAEHPALLAGLTALATAAPLVVRPDLHASTGLGALIAVAAGAFARGRFSAFIAPAAALGIAAASLPQGTAQAALAAMLGGSAGALGLVLRQPKLLPTPNGDWKSELLRRFGRPSDEAPDRAEQLVRAAARVVADSVERTVEVARAALRAHRVTVLWLDSRASATRVVAASPPDSRVAERIERHPFLAALRRVQTPVVRDASQADENAHWRLDGPEPHLVGTCLFVDGVARGYLVAERDSSATPFSEREAEMLHALGLQVLDILEREELILDAARARSDIGLHFEAADQFNRTVTVDDVCRTARVMLERIVKLDLFVVTRTREGESTQQVVYAEGPHDEKLRGAELNEPETLLGIAARQLEVQPFTGVLRNREVRLLGRDFNFDEIRSVRVFPLAVGGICIGTFVLGTRREGALDTAATERLRVLIQLATAALANALAYAWAIHTATTDSMTGLTNHRTFKERAAEALARAERSGRPLSVILTDIDHFKRVNDTYGHSIGDQVIIAVAEILRSSLRRVDLGARYGGEEFAILLEEADTGAAVALAERIREAAAARTFQGGERSFGVTLSLGVATYPADAKSVADLVDAADKALYAAKHAGRNQTVRADSM